MAFPFRINREYRIDRRSDGRGAPTVKSWWNVHTISIKVIFSYGRAYAIVLRPSSVSRLPSIERIVAKRCIVHVTIDSLQEVVYEKSTGTKMNDLDLCLEVVSRLCQPLRYIRWWISRKQLEIKASFQRTTHRKWPTGNQMVTWPMTSRDPERSNLKWPPIRLECNISKQMEMLFRKIANYYLVCSDAVRSAILATAWLLVR